ncbi:MAG: hypothetical protein OEV28_13505 [Nitrospirota bacterium]|nr:hypothetical protein [Nitrospirota bacterium]
MQDGFFTSISEMEPMMPADFGKKVLEELAIEVIRKSAALSSALHPLTRRGIAELVRKVNSYYSNLIEGHNTHPVDIDRALRKDFSSEPAIRARQLESMAHIEVQKLIEARIEAEPDLLITGRDFLCWIHKEFYDRMPEEYLYVKQNDGISEKIIPGEVRKREVVVGRHLPPKWEYVGRFMDRLRRSMPLTNWEA